MNEKIRHLLGQIRELEDEMQAELSKHSEKFVYQIKGKKIEFERTVKDRHRQLKTGIFRWLTTVSPLNLLTAPVIYGMFIPLVAFDFFIMFYQFSCFPIYHIPLVKRSEYFSFDHRHLAYLNMIEKFNCMYCSYANGLMAFASEVVARTEQFFCPIKHARKLKGVHIRSKEFLEYGDAVEIQKKLVELRKALIVESAVK